MNSYVEWSYLFSSFRSNSEWKDCVIYEINDIRIHTKHIEHMLCLSHNVLSAFKGGALHVVKETEFSSSLFAFFSSLIKVSSLKEQVIFNLYFDNEKITFYAIRKKLEAENVGLANI